MWDNYSLESSESSMEGFYLALIRDVDFAAINMQPLKILVFSGDNDAVSCTLVVIKSHDFSCD